MLCAVSDLAPPFLTRIYDKFRLSQKDIYKPGVYMQKNMTSRPEIKIVGISLRTNNDAEVNWHTGKIFPCVQRYFHQGINEKIPNRLKPGTTFCVYTEYESDHTGDYTYFIGEEVSSFEGVPLGLETLIIPAQDYVKFTNGPQPMPQVVREPWFKIWQMSSHELGGTRRYAADFEVYDERAADHNNVVLDIYIGVQ
jgi:predicted transcriptional regulator YdeE